MLQGQTQRGKSPTRPDQPEWLSHVNASVLKVTIIHTVLILSVLGIAYTDRVMLAAPAPKAAQH